MNKIVFAAVAALIVAAPAAIDKFTMAAKADNAARPTVSLEHEGDEEGCRTRKIVERALDGSLHIKKVQRCA
jgi:hypothetical protein